MSEARSVCVDDEFFVKVGVRKKSFATHDFLHLVEGILLDFAPVELDIF